VKLLTWVTNLPDGTSVIEHIAVAQVQPPVGHHRVRPGRPVAVAGLLEAPAFAAFLPRLAVRLTGEELRIPNIATWWCGQDAERTTGMNRLDDMVIGPAFKALPRGLPNGARIGAELTEAERAVLRADLDMRGIDYVVQETVRLSTMPIAGDAGLEPRPFTLRVFATRDARGAWSVMPGGFARIGDTVLRAGDVATIEHGRVNVEHDQPVGAASGSSTRASNRCSGSIAWWSFWSASDWAACTASCAFTVSLSSLIGFLPTSDF